MRKAIKILGDKCVRCGIDYPLALDHINGDPIPAKNGDYRRALHAEQKEFTKIIKTGVSDRLQLLCHNCNWMKYHNPEEYKKPARYGMTEETNVEVFEFPADACFS